ncbi:hypothetical protein BH20ACI2_BH20ACI2_19900 [soil metagenome]
MRFSDDEAAEQTESVFVDPSATHSIFITYRGFRKAFILSRNVGTLACKRPKDADERGEHSSSLTPSTATPEEPALQARMPAFPADTPNAKS